MLSVNVILYLVICLLGAGIRYRKYDFEPANGHQFFGLKHDFALYIKPYQSLNHQSGQNYVLIE
jgi:hypothetical protein